MTEPKTMTAAEQDKRLEERTEQICQETEALEAKNEQLAQLVARKEVLLANWEKAWQRFQQERQQIDRELAQIIPAGHK
jgi:SMC interacting uncharacterized protein involved in chromosome segregation